MKSTDAPSLITTPFAQNGTRNDIPTSDPGFSGDDAGRAAFTTGFPDITMRPITAGGKPPFGADFNGVLYALSNAARFYGAGGHYQFNGSFAAAIGGYPMGATVQASDNMGHWLNVVESNTTNPESALSTGWLPLADHNGTATVTVSGNTTLSALQAAKANIRFAGSPSGNSTITFPAWTKRYSIINDCTGDQSLICTTGNGESISIKNGAKYEIGCDGRNLTVATLNASQVYAEPNKNISSLDAPTVQQIINSLGSAARHNEDDFDSHGSAATAKSEAIEASTLRDSSRRVGFIGNDKLNPYIEYFSQNNSEIVSIARAAWVAEIQQSFKTFRDSLGDASKRNVSTANWDKMPSEGDKLTTESQLHGLHANTIKSDYALAHGFINSDKARPYTRHADGTVVEAATAEALKNLANSMGDAAKQNVSKAPWNGMPEKGSLLTTESQMFGLYANTIKSDYALAHGFIDGNKNRPYTRHADDSVVEVTPRSALKDGAYHDVSRVTINDAKAGSEALATEGQIADIASSYQRAITIGVDGRWGRVKYPNGFVEMWGVYNIGNLPAGSSEYPVRFPSKLSSSPSHITITVDCTGVAVAKVRNTTGEGMEVGVKVIEGAGQYASVMWSVRGYLA